MGSLQYGGVCRQCAVIAFCESFQNLEMRVGRYSARQLEWLQMDLAVFFRRTLQGGLNRCKRQQ
jgi:hypothetical protein